MAKIDVVTKSPRMFIEMIVVSLVMLAIIIYLMAGQSPDQIFKMVSLFAIVAIRLMPSLSRISTGWGSIKAWAPVFEEVHGDIVNCEKFESSRRQQEVDKAAINFEKNIEMADVSFSYENSQRLALEHVSFSITKNSTIGFVGPSGAGKTTLIDIILGLLKPTSGKVLVDGADIHQSIRSWQDKIGYIPQAIYLCDDSIKSNIAFGLPSEQVDDQKVWHALRLAQLEEFIRSLPQGIETTIGERGIRLSGGQRQRIGIARALYNDPELLVMDEATAALDNETERSFMESLTNLSGAKTILIIAHRLTTVRKCDTILFFKNGKLVSAGPYDELLAQCTEFSQMAGLGAL
jgi:ATP-binding cassette subfamily C protein